ncbi:MAG: formylmethanofuran dehydrogenase subunit E family protein [Candidatus Helarchaeota archaeon]
MEKELIDKAVLFHGHLGPFLILGLKMGQMAIDYLKPSNYNEISAEVLINPLSTPESCVIDGIQVSTCCTTGKRNLIVKEKNTPGIEAIFIGKDKKIEIKVKDIALGVIKHKLSDHHHSHHSHGTVEDVANEIIDQENDALFDYELK